jgi:hypothetical protein
MYLLVAGFSSGSRYLSTPKLGKTHSPALAYPAGFTTFRAIRVGAFAHPRPPFHARFAPLSNLPVCKATEDPKRRSRSAGPPVRRDMTVARRDITGILCAGPGPETGSRPTSGRASRQARASVPKASVAGDGLPGLASAPHSVVPAATRKTDDLGGRPRLVRVSGCGLVCVEDRRFAWLALSESLVVLCG